VSVVFVVMSAAFQTAPFKCILASLAYQDCAAAVIGQSLFKQFIANGLDATPSEFSESKSILVNISDSTAERQRRASLYSSLSQSSDAVNFLPLAPLILIVLP